MKFTDGYWQDKPGLHALRAVEVDDIRVDHDAGTRTVYAPTAVVRGRGDTLDRPLLTLTYSSPAPGVVTVRVEHHAGVRERGPHFAVRAEAGFRPRIDVDDVAGVLQSGDLTVRVHRGGPWRVDVESGGRALTSSLPKSVAAIASDDGGAWVHEQLSLDPGERIFGLGERFGPVVKNGQAVDVWNEDGLDAGVMRQAWFAPRYPTGARDIPCCALFRALLGYLGVTTSHSLGGPGSASTNGFPACT